jgi:hypothetical protein
MPTVQEPEPAMARVGRLRLILRIISGALLAVIVLAWLVSDPRNRALQSDVQVCGVVMVFAFLATFVKRGV